MTAHRRQPRAKVAGFDASERDALRRASVVVRLVVDLRARRLRHLPDETELAHLGELIERDEATPADVALVRSLPGPYLRGHASIKHYALFVECRRFDGS